MPTLDACGSGVDCHHVILCVAHDLEYVGMAADEYLGPEAVDKGSGAKVIMTGITAYMGHEDRHPSAFEELMMGVLQTDVLSVTVAVDADKGFESRYPVCCSKPAAEVSGMPYLIYRSEKFLELFVEYSVSV